MHSHKLYSRKSHIKYSFKPFLIHPGFSCSCCVQASLYLNCLKLTIPGFPYNCLPVSCGDISFKKKTLVWYFPGIRHQSAFTAFRAFLPSKNYSAEWSGRVWQPSADSNGHLAPFFKIWNRHYSQQRSVSPNPGSSNKKKVRHTAITICRGLSHPTGWAALPSENISRYFFKGGKTLWRYK